MIPVAAFLPSSGVVFATGLVFSLPLPKRPPPLGCVGGFGGGGGIFLRLFCGAVGFLLSLLLLPNIPKKPPLSWGFVGGGGAALISVGLGGGGMGGLPGGPPKGVYDFDGTGFVLAAFPPIPNMPPVFV